MNFVFKHILKIKIFSLFTLIAILGINIANYDTSYKLCNVKGLTESKVWQKQGVTFFIVASVLQN